MLGGKPVPDVKCLPTMSEVFTRSEVRGEVPITGEEEPVSDDVEETGTGVVAPPEGTTLDVIEDVSTADQALSPRFCLSVCVLSDGADSSGPVDVAIDAELSFFSQKELLGSGEAGEAAVALSVPGQQVRMRQMVKASRCLWPGLPRGTRWPPPISSRCVQV